MYRSRTTSDAHATSNAPAASQSADEFLEGYLRWREQSAAVQSAYERWRAAPPVDRALTFAAYQSALDLEEQAAGALRECAVRVSVIA